MSTAIRKHLRDFAAIVGLLVIALIVAVIILDNQRLSLPAGVPMPALPPRGLGPPAGPLWPLRRQ